MNLAHGTPIIQHSTFNIQHSTFPVPHPPPHYLTHLYASLLTRARDCDIHLPPPPFAQHVEDALRDERVEEPLPVDVGRQHPLGRLAQRAEDVIDLRVLRANQTIEV